MTRKQSYAILGIKEGASLAEVKKAYRKKAFELHPDLSPLHDAGRRFQELNEAYVLMLGFLEEDRATEAGAASRAAGATKKDSSATHSAPSGGAPGNRRASENENRGADSGRQKESTFQSASANTTEPGRPEREKRNASASPYSFLNDANNRRLSKEEVLSNVLHDPFARRVFEDIYREIRHGKKTQGNAPRENPQGFADMLPLRAGRKALYSIKDWFRRQIDDEQTVTVPVSALRPGMRIRLQVQHGMSGKKQNIEVTLPLDYTPGRPMRLRGLGKKIGPWLGDLYLRIVPKPI